MSDITERVQRIIEEKLGVDASEVKPEATFTNDLGADSLDTCHNIGRVRFFFIQVEKKILLVDKETITITL